MASSAVLNFTDPYPYQAAVRGAQLEFLPTEKGSFRAELAKVTFESLWMQRGKESLAQVFREAVAPERSVIGFLTDFDQPNIDTAVQTCLRAPSSSTIIMRCIVRLRQFADGVPCL
jgi:hypothetical protein